MFIYGKIICCPVVFEKSVLGSHPNLIFAVFSYSDNCICAQTSVILGIIPVKMKSSALPVIFLNRSCILNHPQYACPVFETTHYDIAAQTVRVLRIMSVMDKFPGFFVKFLKSDGYGIRMSDPQIALFILHDRVNLVIGQGVGIIRIMAVMGEFPGILIKLVKSATFGSDPEISVHVFSNCINPVSRQGVRIIRIMSVTGKSVGFLIEFVQPAFLGSYPDKALPVDTDRPDIIITQAVRVTRLMLITGKDVGFLVIFVKPALCADPEQSVIIFRNCFGGPVEVVAVYTVRIIQIVFIPDKCVCISVKTIQPAAQ